LRSEHLFNAPSGHHDLRGSQLNEPRHLMVGTVPAADLHKPVGRPNAVAVRPSRHVAVEQRIGQQGFGGGELRLQLSAEALDVGLDLST
jgi:hypothetical protein